MEEASTRRNAINHLTFGSIILTWGIMLLLKQVGVVEANVSTLPFPLVTFGALLVLSGIIKLSGLRQQ